MTRKKKPKKFLEKNDNKVKLGVLIIIGIFLFFNVLYIVKNIL